MAGLIGSLGFERPNNFLYRNISEHRFERVVAEAHKEHGDRAAATAMGLWDRIKDFFYLGLKREALNLLFDFVQGHRQYHAESNLSEKQDAFLRARDTFLALRRLMSPADAERCLLIWPADADPDAHFSYVDGDGSESELTRNNSSLLEPDMTSVKFTFKFPVPGTRRSEFDNFEFRFEPVHPIVDQARSAGPAFDPASRTERPEQINGIQVRYPKRHDPKSLERCSGTRCLIEKPGHYSHPNQRGYWNE